MNKYSLRRRARRGRRWLCGATFLVASALPAPAAWEPVPPVDLSGLSPDWFTDEELDIPAMLGPDQPLPYYLFHFHRLANAVVKEEPNRGFIDLPVWRRPQDNEPYNARVMENTLSLAYFYSTARPWNPYYGSASVRRRLEAALEFWVSAQHDDGRFSEYAAERWNLPATAFATKFMGETLRLLRGGPPVDENILDSVRQAQRRAIVAVLRREDFYTHAQRFSNQYGNVWGGALAWLDLSDDPKIESLLEQRLGQALKDFISPAGFFYENYGPDWGYAFGTHHSNLAMAWHYARGTRLAKYFVEEEAKWADWLAYNAVPEPDGERFVLNRAVETRTQRWDLVRLETPLAEEVPLMRTFAPTENEVAERRRRVRERVEARWPEVAPMVEGRFSAYSPYAFLHRPHHKWHPTDRQRAEALAEHPVLRSERFIHQRVDDRKPLVYTYVRRPNYYAAFNAGPRPGAREPKRGLGLLWSPDTGVILQSQTDSDAAAWGTRPKGAERVVEATEIDVEYRLGREQNQWLPSPGNRDLPKTTLLTIAYPMGDKGRKSVRFYDDAITVSVTHQGRFTECLPLLLDTHGHLRATPEGISFERNGVEVRVDLRGATKVSAVPVNHTIGNRPLHVVTIEANEELAYQLSISRRPADSR